MSYKSRVVGAAQEILLCRVKDMNGPATKVVNMAYETYLTIRKEMEVEIIGITQAGKPAAYKSRLEGFKGKQEAILPSQRPEWKNASEKRSGTASSEKQTPVNDKTYLPEDTPVGDIPEPPVQNKQRLPGEEKGAFHARRMVEGKAYKKWEREYGEAYAGTRSAESVPESEGARNGRESEAETAGALSDGAPGDETTDQEVPDPIKEAIERASHEELMKQNQ